MLKIYRIYQFFFNQIIANKITENLQKILYSNNEDETLKYKIKEVLKKMIPFNIRENYLREFYNSKGEKSLYNLFKRDLSLYKSSDDKIYYLFEIFEIVKYKLNSKDREELKIIFSKYSYIYNNQNNNNNNIYNNNYYNESSMNKNGGNYLNSNNNYNHNINNNYNKYRKHSYQYNDNNWSDNNYTNTNNYHQHVSYNNNHNYLEDKNNDELGYNKNYDAHHNSSYHKKNNFKGSYSSRHYYNDKNANKMKGKINRKNSAFGSGAVLVEVSTTPKKEENDDNDNINNYNINENNEIQQEKKDEVKKDIFDNNVIVNSTDLNDIKDINDINKDKKEENTISEKENIIINNDHKEKDKGEEENLLINKINVSQDIENEENKDKENINNDNENDKDNENDNNYNNNINNEENDENLDVNIEFNNVNNDDLKEENIITDFNIINPFNEKNNDENEKSEKGDSSNNLKVIYNSDEMEKPNNSKEDEVNNDNENDINDNNDYILNIIEHSDNIFNNMNLFENNNNINKEENHFEHNEDINIINNKEVDENNIKEDEIREDSNINNNDIINEVKKENDINMISLLNSSPKKDLIFNNSANNIKENINLKKKSISDNSQKNLINSNKKEMNSFSDNNLMNLNNNSFPKISNNINWNNNNLSQNILNNTNFSKEQLQLLKTSMQNNNLLNYNPFLNQNLLKINLNNNTFQNHNNIGMNILSNINSGMNLLNLINDISTNINNNNGLFFHNNDSHRYINIFFNYLDEEQNLISSLKPISKRKNNQYNNYQVNMDFLQNSSDKLAYDYKNRIKKLREKNPLLIKENMDLFEDKIILPIYQKISEENQQRKAIYTKVYDKYKSIIIKILEKNNVGDTKVEPYGSIVNNFMTDYGDIDICIELKDHNLLKDFDNYLEEIREEAVDEQKCAKFIILEKYSKFLILKLKDIESEIDLDITVQNILPIENTKLIRLYSLYDQRFHILGIFLKFWVKKNHIHGALDKFLSSYALLILIIHYLQTIIEPKILPILQQIKNEKKECTYFNGEKEISTNIYFEEDLDKAKNYMKIINNNEENESNIVELLIGFFEYYSYSHNHYIISISRSDKIPSNEMETIAFPIEDPFDMGYNPGKSMKLNTLSYAAFSYCMKKELNNILLGTYFKNIKEE